MDISSLFNRTSADSPIKLGAKAVVTGASGGLGQAFCKVLASRGVEVVGADISHVGENVVSEKLDVTNAKACFELANDIKPDIWINNAGLLGAGDYDKISDEVVEAVVKVNLLGVVHGTRAACSVMVPRGSGAILNVGSLASWSPTAGLGIYSATKFGVRGYTHSVASEIAKSGVSISLLCPDGIWTPMLKAVVDDPAAAMPFSGGKLLDPLEVAKFGIGLVDKSRLTGSLPLVRAVAGRLSGEFPKLIPIVLGKMKSQGVHMQDKYHAKLEKEN
ncbi:MAG: SDR family oxidoreductase [Acidimicrobiales bacterium]|nr:SDR family oxidoreductase [Acidimicrobiales bacterium]